ncbi:MAG: PIN domain-containing protein [Chloroflexi bacterium]|nr:PIN domain-containing protein [Chloroflexota bacterium]
MMILVDSSFLYAIYNAQDSRHQEALAARLQPRDSLLIPNIILPEVCYLFTRDLGYAGVQTFLRNLAEMGPQLSPLLADDLQRMSEIAQDYASAEFDIVDCCIMAMAERLDVARIATFDRRDFAIFRPQHCNFLELLP